MVNYTNYLDTKQCKKKLDNLIDMHKTLIDALDQDRGNILVSKVTKTKEFIKSFEIFINSRNWEVQRDKCSNEYTEIFKKAEAQMALLQESIRLLERTIGIQSYYEHEVAICGFEPYRVGRRMVDVGGFAKVMEEFLLEDSSVPNLTLNYDDKLKTARRSPHSIGVPVVIKKVRGWSLDREQNMLGYEENLLERLVLLDHPNIVQIIPREVDKTTVVMRDAGTHVEHFFRGLHQEEKEQLVPSKQYKMRIAKMDFIARVLAQLFNAVQYIHERGYVHADIHTQNLMIDASARVRLIDFGCAMQIGTKIDPDNTFLCSTEPFPRMKGAVVGTAPDIWAIGQVLLRLIDMDESSGIKPQMFKTLLNEQQSVQSVQKAKDNVYESARKLQKKASDTFVSMGKVLNSKIREATKGNAEVLKDMDEQNKLVGAMRERHEVLSEIAVKLLFSYEHGDGERISTVDEAFRGLRNYPEIEVVLSIIDGKYEKEKNFGTELSAKIKPKHP